MKNEIERKFFVKAMPNLSGIYPRRYERYFIQIGPIEKRIQKVDSKYSYEEKSEVSGLERSRDVKKEITEKEFDSLKQGAKGPLIRERFDISFNPNVSIQVYKEQFEGLVRAEVEFDSNVEAKAFVPFDWMGEEITDMPIARDSKLVDLDPSEFKRLIQKP